MLDAGCGSALPLDFPSSVHLVGLDVSPEALARNQNIDEGLVGDIETYPLPEAEYDAVLCWTVLEHLPNPRAALANMSRSLKPGGLLIVGIPNLWSLKGLITKLSPHAFHVWTYRRLLRIPNAGAPGFPPFRTYLRRAATPRGLAVAAAEENLERIYAATYATALRLPRSLRAVWSGVGVLGRVLTLGRWDPEASDHAAVFRKRMSSDNPSVVA